MTDAEQRALSGRIATLAEQAGLPSAIAHRRASLRRLRAEQEAAR